jgi:hypothetical protein
MKIKLREKGFAGGEGRGAEIICSETSSTKSFARRNVYVFLFHLKSKKCSSPPLDLGDRPALPHCSPPRLPMKFWSP